VTEVAVPEGWTKSRLGDLGRYINGRGFKKSEWATTGRPIIRIQNLTGSSGTFNYFDGEVEERYVVRPGDLLISWAATLGAYFWNGPEGVLNQHIFRVESSIDPRFHKHLLDHKLAELYTHTHGSGMVHITRGKFDAIEVLLPPPNEQRRIVEILEDLMSRLDAAGDYVHASMRRCGRFIESWLRDALEPVAQENRRLGDVVIESRGGWSRSRSHLVEPDEGTPYLKMNNIARSGDLVLDEVVHVAAADADLAKYAIRPGDVLFNSKNSGDLIGKSAVADERVAGWVFNENIIRLRFTGDVSSEYAGLWLLGPQARRQITSSTSASTNVAAVYLHALREFEMWVPDSEVQARLVAEYRERRSSVDRLRRELDAQVQRAVLLRRSLLAAAFSGRLTGAESDIEQVEEMAGA
jgi:type I restriction enzyme S subunit